MPVEFLPVSLEFKQPGGAKWREGRVYENDKGIFIEFRYDFPAILKFELALTNGEWNEVTSLPFNTLKLSGPWQSEIVDSKFIQDDVLGTLLEIQVKIEKAYQDEAKLKHYSLSTMYWGLLLLFQFKSMNFKLSQDHRRHVKVCFNTPVNTLAIGPSDQSNFF